MEQDLVRQWMTAHTISIEPDATIEEAERLMDEQGIHRLAVLSDGSLVGIVSVGDVRAAKSVANGSDSVASIMTADPITISDDANVALAAQTMLQLHVSGLPVLDEAGNLCGMLSSSDLFRYIVELNRESNSVEWEA